ncbi:MAG: helix-turn-helix transcriptional regulator [Pseudomonadota bacterium]
MVLANNVKQAELARKIGARKATVGQAVNGQTHELSATFAVRAALACDVDPFWLVLGEGEARDALRVERRSLSPKAVYIGTLLDALPDKDMRGRSYLLIVQLLELLGSGQPNSAKAIGGAPPD